MLSPQDFARLLQDKLIDAGEQRAVEFKPDLFGFVPRGGDLSSIFPLDNYYRYYLAATSDAERQRVVKQFASDWLRHAKAGAPVAPGSGGAPAGGWQSHVAAPVVMASAVPPMGYPPPRPLQATSGGGGRVLITIFAIVGLTLVCMCVAPQIMGVVMLVLAKNRVIDLPGPRPRDRGPKWEFQPPPETKQTELAGRQQGLRRFYSDPQLRPVLGFSYSTREWFGEQVIALLVPLYDERDPPPPHFNVRQEVVRAKEGYVVGGLEVDAQKYVNAVRINFVRRTDQGLDLSDTYQSDWLGTPTGREPQTLSGEGQQVLGIAALQSLALDGVGLIYRQQAAAPNDNVPLNPEP